MTGKCYSPAREPPQKNALMKAKTVYSFILKLKGASWETDINSAGPRWLTTPRKQTPNHEQQRYTDMSKTFIRFVVICYSAVTVSFKTDAERGDRCLQVCGLESSARPSPSAIFPAILHYMLSRKAEVPQKSTLYVQKKKKKKAANGLIWIHSESRCINSSSFSLQRSLGNNVSEQSSKNWRGACTPSRRQSVCFRVGVCLCVQLRRHSSQPEDVCVCVCVFVWPKRCTS